MCGTVIPYMFHYAMLTRPQEGHIMFFRNNKKNKGSRTTWFDNFVGNI